MLKEVKNAAAKDAAATSAKVAEEKEVKEKVAETATSAKSGDKEKVTENTEVVEEKKEKSIFETEAGDKYELIVDKFLFKGQRYFSEMAINENQDVLEHLVGLNSKIFKKL